VLIYHEHGGFLLRGDIKTRLTYAFFARFYNAFVALHRVMVDYMVQASKVCAKKTVIIENAVDVDYFRPSNESNLYCQEGDTVWTIGAVGRLTPEKDINLFLETARLIIRKRENIKFTIVGTGSMHTTLLDAAQDPELQGRVDFIGARSDVPNVLRTFDLFLCTSRVDTFPVTVLESLACGVPVVVAQVELGTSTKIFEKFPGVSLVQERNARALADMCLSLLENQKQLNAMAQAGREYVVKHNSIQTYVKSIDDLYQSLLGNYMYKGQRRA